MISVLVPWRSNDEHRIRAWHYNRLRWQRLDVELCVADDGRTEGPFSFAAAANRARAQATGDVLVMFGADHVPPDPDRLAWIEQRLRDLPWTAVYQGTWAINETGTARVVDEGMPVEVAGRLRADHIGLCEGVLALRAEVWDDIGGMDAGFVGWGAEDTALRCVLTALYPDGGEGEGDCYTLWHPTTPHDVLTEANIERCRRYQDAAAAGRMRDYLEEVRRGRPGDAD